MESRIFWIIRQSLRKVWVRVIGFAFLAILTVILAPILAIHLSIEFGAGMGSVPVDQILTILASSMLAVTTFSLSIAVSAFAAAASTATPRATALLQEDPTTQNVLATFLGAFLFSLIGMIALRTDFYDGQGQVFLFLATLAVVVLVIIALLRWIGHLMTFGRMSDTLDRVERAATNSLAQRLGNPYLGGKPLQGRIPDNAQPLISTCTGYVQHIDMNALAECAREFDGELYVAVLPGSFVHLSAKLLWVHGNVESENQKEALREAVTISNERTFDQDPRFGLIVLSEIACRALSPAVNDPGTAIGVIGRLVRILSYWEERAEPEIDYPEIHVPVIATSDLLYDAFRPIARDGAAIIEVQMRLHKALDALTNISPLAFAEPAAFLSIYALERTAQTGVTSSELSAIKAAAIDSTAS